eukprot:3733365-Amphidinium_carterae.1
MEVQVFFMCCFALDAVPQTSLGTKNPDFDCKACTVDVCRYDGRDIGKGAPGTLRLQSQDAAACRGQSAQNCPSV